MKIRVYVGMVIANFSVSICSNYPEFSNLRSEYVSLYLFYLLVESKLVEFHSYFESVSSSLTSNSSEFVTFILKLENYLMEGSYNKILSLSHSITSTSLTNSSKVLITLCQQKLSTTVRREIMDGMEVSYKSLKLNDAMKLMMFKSPQELVEYVKSEKVSSTSLDSLSECLAI